MIQTFIMLVSRTINWLIMVYKWKNTIEKSTQTDPILDAIIEEELDNDTEMLFFDYNEI